MSNTMVEGRAQLFAVRECDNLLVGEEPKTVICTDVFLDSLSQYDVETGKLELSKMNVAAKTVLFVSVKASILDSQEYRWMLGDRVKIAMMDVYNGSVLKEFYQSPYHMHTVDEGVTPPKEGNYFLYNNDLSWYSMVKLDGNSGIFFNISLENTDGATIEDKILTRFSLIALDVSEEAT